MVANPSCSFNILEYKKDFTYSLVALSEAILLYLIWWGDRDGGRGGGRGIFFPVKNALSIIQKDTCPLVFIAALFTAFRTWRQPKCTSTEEQIKKLW